MLGLTACADRPVHDLVRQEKAAGHYGQYCSLARKYADSDRSLLVDLGECYEHGWGQLPRDRETAINYYEQAARWGDQEAADRLRRLGVDVPGADLLREEHRHSEERRAKETRHALLLAVVGTGKSIDDHPHHRAKGGPLGSRAGTSIASSPAFDRYIASLPDTANACALVFVKGRRADSAGACE
jgi:hypothetical protein